LTRPQSILRLLNNIEKKPEHSDDGNYAELISIAVSPSTENIGIGTELIRNFEEQAKMSGCMKIALTTDFYYNERVIAFYKKSGYSVYYDFTAFPNRKMYKLIKEII
jgi:ribosomal protein S18 acetylase RimI-like enzyme